MTYSALPLYTAFRPQNASFIVCPQKALIHLHQHAARRPVTTQSHGTVRATIDAGAHGTGRQDWHSRPGSTATPRIHVPQHARMRASECETNLNAYQPLEGSLRDDGMRAHIGAWSISTTGRRSAEGLDFHSVRQWNAVIRDWKRDRHRRSSGALGRNKSSGSFSLTGPIQSSIQAGKRCACRQAQAPIRGVGGRASASSEMGKR